MGDIRKDLNSLMYLFEKYKLKNISTYAKKHGVSRMSVYRWIEDGSLKYVTLGGIKYIIEA